MRPEHIETETKNYETKSSLPYSVARESKKNRHAFIIDYICEIIRSTFLDISGVFRCFYYVFYTLYVWYILCNYFEGHRKSLLPEPGESCLAFMFFVCTAHYLCI